MKTDYLYGTPYNIIQDKELYHFNSDTEFLGRMLKIKAEETVLDIGTNTGALLLFASMHTKHLCGIDLFPEQIARTRSNLFMNGLEGETYVCRIQDFQHEPFDVILCNPPYFNTKDEHLKNDNMYKRAARHEEYLTPDELFQAVGRLLRKDGHFWMVHRASRRQELIHMAEKYGLYPCLIRIAYDHIGGIEKSVVMVFGREFGPCYEAAPAFMDQRDSFVFEACVK